MYIDDFKIWIDLVNTQSFSKCAELNFLSQPAISHKIKLLERKFNTRLFVRSKKRLRLTDTGKILYAESRKIVGEYQNLSAKINSLSGITHGTIKAAAIYGVGLYALNKEIKDFIKKYPAVHLDLEFSHCSKIYQALLEGRIDIGFVAYPRNHPRLEIIHFKKEDLILVTHPQHPLGRLKNIAIREIDGQEFIGFEKNVPTQEALSEIFKRHRIKVRMKMEFDNIELIKRAVENNTGISILPAVTIRQEIEHRTLKGVPFRKGKFLRPLGMLIRKDKALSPATRKFIEELAGSSATAF